MLMTVLRPQTIGLLLILLLQNATLLAQKSQVRVSAWYWLNSAPKVDWEGDFVTMHNLGFTDVVLAWGVDAAAFATRIEDSRDALKWANQAGIGAYLIMWHPSANSFERNPKFQFVDSAGKTLRTFDVFNPVWRATQWKEYLQKVANAYKDERALAGYVFDDSFEVGGNGEVSYGEYELSKFGKQLPRRKTDPNWKEWGELRAGWWEDWARDTTQFIRQVDPDRKHEIYIEDTDWQILHSGLADTVGLDFPRVAQHFDAVGAYTTAAWDSSPDSGTNAAKYSEKVLHDLREMMGPNTQIIYTFWVANITEELQPGAAHFPSAEQIRLVCDAALQAGIKHIDMYGFRIGDYRVSSPEEFKQKAPGTGPHYPLTGQFNQKFVWDRPEILDDLGTYLRSLNGQ
jgi:hypothetical protein